MAPSRNTQVHPILFSLIALCAMAEMGLSVFLVAAGNESRKWSSSRYHAMLIVFVTNSSWTILFATAYLMWFIDQGSLLLAHIASSVVWLVITTIMWGVAAGVMHYTRTGGRCVGRATVSRCRQSLTVEALGWTEFSLCAAALVVTCTWMYTKARILRVQGSLQS